MSIPPLVCSTPPPPDQCEDDKDPEEFDIQYNLSQDDDENYDYGNFSSYNHFQAATNENKKTDVPIIAKVIVNDKINDPTEENKDVIENALGTTTTGESKLKLEEDINIEDLNLIVDETIQRTNITETKDNGIERETINNNIDCSSKEPDVLVKNIVTDDGSNSFELPTSELVLEPHNVEDIQIDEIPPLIDEIIEDEIVNPKVDQFFTETTDFKQGIKNNDELRKIDDPFVETVQFEEETIKESVTLSKLEESDDDFGDFDNFQFASTDKPAILLPDDNPWNTEKVVDSNFDFQANFDDSASNIIERKIEHSSNIESENKELNIPVVSVDDDDDFGDFDDFKSSATENVATSDETFANDEVTVLNLQSGNENQLMENIEKILSSIFEEEIPVPDSEFDGKLESYLSETWGHLLETDVRQPYIVNWNNSLGQQTLLKSLCIDSRNILFGPKWSYNMPKYAANLSAAPLQPQKQPTTSSESTSQPEKPAGKSTGTWSDPFSSDGQESCSNTDASSENTTPALRPTDLDLLEATVKPKPELFSSTINIQPLRQISLPDTHIFTPTDSETPRSKTIHYDSSPAVLLAQNAMESNKNISDTLNPQPSTSTAPDADNEYWEFQDFKGASETSASHPSEQSENASTTKITHGTQLLQPIKLDPIMPKLNWPDPGEVKETFDDFSDFVSNSTSIQSNEKHELSNPATLDNSKSSSEPERQSATVRKETTMEGSTSNAGDGFDDEFDTFQSALPTSKSTPDFNFTNFNNDATLHVNTSPQKMPQSLTDFDNIFPKIPKSETISFSNPIRPNNSLVQNPMPLPVNSITSENSVKSLPVMPTTSMINTNLLQPTPASSSSTQSQQKSGQILQPLSLESYSQINWPNPGIDLQDLSRFNPVETLQSLKSDLSANNHSKGASPVHQVNSTNSQASDDDIWGEFVSSKPKQQQAPKKTTFADDDEWTDFVSSPSVKPQNGLNTISFNVHTNLSMQKTPNQGKYAKKSNQIQLDIPSLNYITPKTSNHKTYNDRHFQNL